MDSWLRAPATRHGRSQGKEPVATQTSQSTTLQTMPANATRDASGCIHRRIRRCTRREICREDASCEEAGCAPGSQSDREDLQRALIRRKSLRKERARGRRAPIISFVAPEQCFQTTTAWPEEQRFPATRTISNPECRSTSGAALLCGTRARHEPPTERQGG